MTGQNVASTHNGILGSSPEVFRRCRNVARKATVDDRVVDSMGPTRPFFSKPSKWGVDHLPGLSPRAD